VQLDSFRELYTSKTDGELLSLAADKNSLVESARLALADELRRRNLDDLPVPEPSHPGEATSQPDHKMPSPSRVLWLALFLWLGLFLLDTFLVYLCAWRVPVTLVKIWLAWFAPIFGTPSTVAPVDWHLRYRALMAIPISLIAGYIDLGRFLPATVGKQIAGRRSRAPGTWVWIVPAAVLLCAMVQFRASSSVLGPSVSVFRYFFDIQQAMLASDWACVRVQMLVTAPFYGGIAYSFGALAWKHRLLPMLFGFDEHLSQRP
jgi:hypothetical protein